MSVHMVRVFAAKDVSLEDAQTAVSKWLNKHAVWTNDTIPHEIVATNTNTDTGTLNYFQGDFRFNWSDTKDDILDDAERDLGSVVSWYRFGYHKCGNDRGDLTTRYDCGWDEVREAGAVPDVIPGFGVTA